MPLVTTKEMFEKSMKEGYAIGAFNINNMEIIQGIVDAAQKQNSPVILGVSEGAAKYMCGFTTVQDMVSAMVKELNITVPVATHLDHGSYEGCLKCIDAGFSSVEVLKNWGATFTIKAVR